MFGKGALIFVVGFAVVFSMYQVKLNRLAVAASDNFNEQYVRHLNHEHANTAMNFAVNHIWQTETDSADMTITTPPCTATVSVRRSGLDTVRVEVLSRSTVYDEEVAAAGSGGSSPALKAVRDSMYAYFTYSLPVSRYFWYTQHEGHIYWVSGDTVWGPVHSNDRIRTHGTPVFYGKVTATRGITPPPTDRRNRARYYGGWEVGPYAELPTDMSRLIQAAQNGAGGSPVNTMSVYDTETSFEFLANGDVIRTVGSDPPDTVAVSSIAPTGVLYINDDVNVEGVLDGQLTVYSTGNVNITDDLVYADDPNVNPDSDDILGLVSDANVMIAETAENNNDVNLMATVLAINGSFGAANYAGRPTSGTLYLTGSIAQDRRGPVGTFGNFGINHGFQKNYRFDPRLADLAAPHFPYVRILNLVAWWE
jgi:hypothetical protein